MHELQERFLREKMDWSTLIDLRPLIVQTDNSSSRLLKECVCHSPLPLVTFLGTCGEEEEDSGGGTFD